MKKKRIVCHNCGYAFKPGDNIDPTDLLCAACRNAAPLQFEIRRDLYRQFRNRCGYLKPWKVRPVRNVWE